MISTGWKVYITMGSNSARNVEHLLNPLGDKYIDGIFSDILYGLFYFKDHHEEMIGKMISLSNSLADVIKFLVTNNEGVQTGLLEENIELNKKFISKLVEDLRFNSYEEVSRIVWQYIDEVNAQFNNLFKKTNCQSLVRSPYYIGLTQTGIVEIDKINSLSYKEILKLFELHPSNDEDLKVILLHINEILNLFIRKNKIIQDIRKKIDTDVFDIIITKHQELVSQLKKINSLYEDDSWRDAKNKVFELLNDFYSSISKIETRLLKISNILKHILQDSEKLERVYDLFGINVQRLENETIFEFGERFQSITLDDTSLQTKSYLSYLENRSEYTLEKMGASAKCEELCNVISYYQNLVNKYNFEEEIVAT